MQDQNDRIRQRAHDPWEREGRPEGRHAEHWEQARREIEAAEGRAVSAGPAAPDDGSSPTPTAPDHGGSTPAEAAAAATAVGAPRTAEVGPAETDRKGRTR